MAWNVACHEKGCSNCSAVEQIWRFALSENEEREADQFQKLFGILSHFEAIWCKIGPIKYVPGHAAGKPAQKQKKQHKHFDVLEF